MQLVARQRLASNFIAVLVGQVGTWLLTSATFIVIPRYLGPEGAGLVGLGWAYAGVLTTVTGLGLLTFITREVARDGDASSKWLPSAAVLQILLSLAGTGLLAAGLTFGGTDKYQILVITACCAIVPVLHVSSLVIAALQGMELMRPAAAYDVVSKFGMLLIAGITIAWKLSLLQFILLTHAVIVVVTLHQLLYFRQYLPLSLRNVSVAHTRRVVRSSLPFLAVAVCFTLYTSVDIIVLEALAGASAVGLYLPPSRLLGAMLFVPVALSTVIFPQLSALHGTDEPRFARMCSQIILLAFVTSLGIAIVAGFGGGPLVAMALGPEFADSASILVVFALVLVPTSLSTIVGRIAFASDRQRSLWTFSLVGLLTKVVLAVLLIPQFESAFGQPALGAAVVVLITETMIAVGMILAYLPRETMSRDAGAKAAAAIVASGLAVSAALPAMVWSPFLAAAVGGLTFGGAVLVLRVYSFGELRGMLPARFGPVALTAE